MRDVSIEALIPRKNTFPAQDLHRRYYPSEVLIRETELSWERAGCSSETIEREKKRLFQV